MQRQKRLCAISRLRHWRSVGDRSISSEPPAGQFPTIRANAFKITVPRSHCLSINTAGSPKLSQLTFGAHITLSHQPALLA